MDKKYIYLAIGAVVVVVLFLGIFVALNNIKSVKSEADKNMVIIQQSTFSPSTITITKGSTVKWRNDDSYLHRIVADDSSFDLGDQTSDAIVSHTFTDLGTYSYHCSVHTFMKGMVIVQ